MNMPIALSRRTLVVLGAAVALAAVLAVVLATQLGGGPSPATAADHRDSPGLMPTGGDPNVDINDIYAFQNPNRASRTTFVITVNGLAEAGQPDFFGSSVPSVARDMRVNYYLYVDRDRDAIADVTYRFRFGNANANGVQRFELRRNGKVLIPFGKGRTTAFGADPNAISGKLGTKVFAGMSDDPFFFDLPGFLNITAPLDGDPSNDSQSFIGCTGDRPDFFAGKNVSSIVLDVPDSQVGSNVAVWSATRLGGEQVDRMGLPALATVFIPANPFEPNEPSMKSAYNHGQPSNDVAQFASEFTDTLQLLYSLNDTGGPVGGTDDPSDDAGKIAGLVAALLPDMVPLDTASDAGFLNGRKLADDVIDAELGLVTEGLVTTDCVDANDVSFRPGVGGGRAPPPPNRFLGINDQQQGP